MNYNNYIKINVNNIYENIKFIKNHYPFSYYIMDISNQAFSHGMYLVKYLTKAIDYFYVHNLEDVIFIRKYDMSAPIIYNGVITSDNIYDLIINDATIVIHDINTLIMIKELSIKDSFDFIFYIDPNGYTGISDKQDILDYLNWDNKYFHLIGVMAEIEEKDYDNFKYIIRPILNCKLMILNFEKNKIKIQSSNAILLDDSIYGINPKNKKLFSKSEKSFKQAFTLYSKINKIQVQNVKNKSKYIAVIPFGYHHGMNNIISKVFIRNKFYEVEKIFNEYTYIIVDEIVKKDMEVEITSFNNPLDAYMEGQSLNYFHLLSQYNPIIYDDCIVEKMIIC